MSPAVSLLEAFSVARNEYAGTGISEKAGSAEAHGASEGKEGGS
jgi:hypothetical protein